MRRAVLAAVAMLSAAAGAASAQEAPLRLFAAGGLRAALTEAADVFASANLGHPQALSAAGRAAGPAVLFARNRLCGLLRPGIDVGPSGLLDLMLDPGTSLGASIPGADPSGDDAWALFRRAKALRPGAQAALQGKARQLVGSPNSAPPSADGRSAYGALLAAGAADVFLTDCTNAAAAARKMLGATVVDLPPDRALGAEHGLILLSDRPGAARLALLLLAPVGQAVLARHGFDAPLLPAQP